MPDQANHVSGVRHRLCGLPGAHDRERELDVAAVIVEPVVGTNGVLVPPPEYMPKLRQICDRYGVLLIADEVMTVGAAPGRGLPWIIGGLSRIFW